MTAPSSTVVVPGEPAPRKPRGFGVGLVLGLVATVGVVVAERSGALPPLSDGAGTSADDAEDVPFTDPDRLQTALDAAVAEAGSSRAAQLLVDEGDVSIVLYDPASQVWTRYQEYEFDEPGDGYSSPLASSPPAEAEFALEGLTADVLLDALTTGNRALRNDPEELEYLQVLVERPFPAYGDVLMTVSERYSSTGSRVFLALDGTVLRAELE